MKYEIRVFNNKLEARLTLTNEDLGLYQSCTEDELIVVESNLLNSVKVLHFKVFKVKIRGHPVFFRECAFGE